jgi:SnoaL-like domain
MSPELRELTDKQAIAETVFRYCRAIDRLDEALLRDCFHPEATHCQGGFEGLSADFCGYALARLAAICASHHQIGNVLITLRTDTADVESYFVAYHRIPAQGVTEGLFASSGVARDLFVGGRYLDRFERRDGRWRIVHRSGVYDWRRDEPAANAHDHEPATPRNVRPVGDDG